MKIEKFKWYIKSLVVSELQVLADHFDRVIQWRPVSNDLGFTTRALSTRDTQVVKEYNELPGAERERNSPSLMLLNANINHDLDIEGTLTKLRACLSRSSRVSLVIYNSYLKFLYQLANKVGLRRGEQPVTFITETDLKNIAKLSGFELVRSRNVGFFPFKLFGIGDFINAVLPTIPIVRMFGLVSIYVLRPVVRESSLPSLSIVIPARNERGNIENALKRMPYFDGAQLEIIYVEGHSTDNTWEEIQRVTELYSSRFTIKAFQQTGKGKVDAVRLGFQHATGDILTILDADLTMPPEKLESFYLAYREGHADFINGSRLVYPMEGEAMRFLNKLGNVFFAKALSFVMGVRIGDSLCGTKLVSRRDYQRFIKWRNKFGDFDPFGDFELLFPAAELCLGIVDIPVRYKDRTYGSTNIRRFRDGLQLLKMTLIGLKKIKLGKIPSQRLSDEQRDEQRDEQSDERRAQTATVYQYKKQPHKEDPDYKQAGGI